MPVVPEIPGGAYHPQEGRRHLRPSKGLFPVKILRTAQGVDGASLEVDPAMINVATLRFGNPDLVDNLGGAAPSHNGHLEEDYLMVHFPRSDTGIQMGDTVACIRGEFHDGRILHGCAAIRTV